MAKYKFGFVGAGRMASALAGGVLQAELASSGEIVASDPNESGRSAFAEAHQGVAVSEDNGHVASESETVVLAVKPQTMSAALDSVAPHLVADSLVVSIAAGITLTAVEAALGKHARVVRVMPNTPCLIGRGASGYSLGQQATPYDAKLVESMLGAVGIAFELPESLLDAVTGLSGSGPAFVYTMIEALSDGGVLSGLPRSTATKLAAQTVSGAAEMVLATGAHPAELREAVTSPGGTTIAGLEALEKGGFRSAVQSAVKAAAGRSKELGQ